MKQLLTVALGVVISTGAYAQLGNYDKDGEVKIVGQKTALSITTTAKTVRSDKEAAGAILGTILAPIVDVGIAIAKEKAKQNVAKYATTFTVSASGDQFWADDKNVNLPTLTITRNVILKSNATETNALKITLIPELSADQTAFRLVVKDPFTFLYSSAKTKGDFDFIDLNIDLKFKAVLVTKSVYEVKDLRATSISIPMISPGTNTIPTDKVYASGWFPLPAIPTLEIETDVTDLDTKTITTTGTKDGKPVNDALVTETNSLKKKGKDVKVLKKNAGLYEFEVTVTETNPYKIKAENKQKLIEGSGDASSKLLKAIIDAATKKEDKKDDKAAAN